MADQKLSKSNTDETFAPEVASIKVPKKKKNETPEERKLRKEAERSLRHPSDVPENKKNPESKKDRKKTLESSTLPTSTLPSSTLPSSTLPEVEKKSSKKSKKTSEVKEEVTRELKTDEVKQKSKKKTVEQTEETKEFESTPLTFGIDVPSSRRRALDREELETYFDQYIKALETELEQTRVNKSRKVNVKTWRLLLNEIRRLKTVSLRVMKKPKRRSENAQSGFMKPVQISSEMAEFAGWSSNDLKSRVDVTKYICNYIKEHNLQNPDDRRQIVADERLSRLLKHDSSSDAPLTYYLLQKKIQPHFILDA